MYGRLPAQLRRDFRPDSEQESFRIFDEGGAILRDWKMALASRIVCNGLAFRIVCNVVQVPGFRYRFSGNVFRVQGYLLEFGTGEAHGSYDGSLSLSLSLSLVIKICQGDLMQLGASVFRVQGYLPVASFGCRSPFRFRVLVSVFGLRLSGAGRPAAARS